MLRGALLLGAGSNARILVDFAQWLAAPQGGGFSGPALVRSFTAVAQAVLLALGDDDESAPPDAAAIAEMISTLDDMPMSEGATLASLHQGLLRFAEFRGRKDRRCCSSLTQRMPGHPKTMKPIRRHMPMRRC